MMDSECNSIIEDAKPKSPKGVQFCDTPIQLNNCTKQEPLPKEPKEPPINSGHAPLRHGQRRIGALYGAWVERMESTRLSDESKPLKWAHHLVGLQKRTEADRLILRDGQPNLVYTNVHKRRRQFIRDIFTTILDRSWLEVILSFVVTFGVTWLGFGLLWFAVVKLKDGCIDNVATFTAAFLFSVETQTTIGYGGRAVTEDCAGAIILLLVQSIIGMLLQCVMTGVVFAKLSVGKVRAKTIVFSKEAVICQRNHNRYFIFRIGDMRMSDVIQAQITVYFVTKKLQTAEGENIPFHMEPLPVTSYMSSDDSYTDMNNSKEVSLIWPVQITHFIDESRTLQESDFEIIVELNGVVESTGAMFQKRCSYLPCQIKWGAMMQPLCTSQIGGRYTVDYSQFHRTMPIHERMMDKKSARKSMKVKRYSTVSGRSELGGLPD